MIAATRKPIWRYVVRVLAIAAALVVAHQVLFCLLLPSVSHSRTVARLSQCKHNLHEIGLALHNYHDVYGSFPPAYVTDGDGRPMHSWRALLLPFLDEPERYALYRFDEPWNSEHNLLLASELSGRGWNPYACPEAGYTLESSYVAVIGSHTAWPGATCRKRAEFTDGTSDTVLVVEVADSGIGWTEPRDLSFDQMQFGVTDPRITTPIGISSRHISNLPGCLCDPEVFCGAHLLMGDGAVRRVFPDAEPQMVRGMLTVEGGEAVGDITTY